MLSILQAGLLEGVRLLSPLGLPYISPRSPLYLPCISQAGAASSKAYARVWQRTNRNVLVDSKPARRRDVLLQVTIER